MSRERSTLVATDVCTYIVSDTFTKWWRALWGTPVPKTTWNPHISQAILFANTIRTPKCVGMIPNTWQKPTIDHNVRHPPKIKRKNYCTQYSIAKNHSGSLWPKMQNWNAISSISPHFQHFDQKNNIRQVQVIYVPMLFRSRQIVCAAPVWYYLPTSTYDAFLVIQLSMTEKELLPMESALFSLDNIHTLWKRSPVFFWKWHITSPCFSHAITSALSSDFVERRHIFI